MTNTFGGKLFRLDIFLSIFLQVVVYVYMYNAYTTNTYVCAYVIGGEGGELCEVVEVGGLDAPSCLCVSHGDLK